MVETIQYVNRVKPCYSVTVCSLQLGQHVSGYAKLKHCIIKNSSLQIFMHAKWSWCFSRGHYIGVWQDTLF